MERRVVIVAATALVSGFLLRPVAAAAAPASVETVARVTILKGKTLSGIAYQKSVPLKPGFDRQRGALRAIDANGFVFPVPHAGTSPILVFDLQ